MTTRPITITALINSKVYDGLLTAAAVPANPGLAAGDTAVFSEAYSDKNVGAGNKTLIPSVVITDGNGGLNYTVTPVNFTTGTITAKPLTITAITNTKVYDGLLTAIAVPTNSGLATGDTAVFSEVYLDKNFGSGNKTLIPSAVITDGNGGLNYTVTPVNFTTGTISKKPITVTAVTNTKTYNGTTAAAAIPSSSGLATGDTAVFSEVYSDKNFGVGNKTLIPSAVITDGNGGLNYTITPVNFNTGTINKAALDPHCQAHLQALRYGVRLPGNGIYDRLHVPRRFRRQRGPDEHRCAGRCRGRKLSHCAEQCSRHRGEQLQCELCQWHAHRYRRQRAACHYGRRIDLRHDVGERQSNRFQPDLKRHGSRMAIPLPGAFPRAASHGSASASGTGLSKAIGYLPNANYLGTDTFVVMVDDGNAEYRHHHRQCDRQPHKHHPQVQCGL